MMRRKEWRRPVEKYLGGSHGHVEHAWGFVRFARDHFPQRFDGGVYGNGRRTIDAGQIVQDRTGAHRSNNHPHRRFRDLF